MIPCPRRNPTGDGDASWIVGAAPLGTKPVVEAEDPLGPPSRAGVRLRLDDRYRLGSRLGGGGMAVVYRTIDERLDRAVAVKLLDPARYGNDDTLARFEREAQAAASIQHPNVVAVHDFGRDGDVLFIVMERLPGRTMADEIAAGPLEVSRVTALLDDVLAGLAAADDKQVLHRDIKPGNVLITVNGARSSPTSESQLRRSTISRKPGSSSVRPHISHRSASAADGRPFARTSTRWASSPYEALSGRRPFDESSPLTARVRHHRRRCTAAPGATTRRTRCAVRRDCAVDVGRSGGALRQRATFGRRWKERRSRVRVHASTPTRPQVEVAATVSAATERMRAVSGSAARAHPARRPPATASPRGAWVGVRDRGRRVDRRVRRHTRIVSRERDATRPSPAGRALRYRRRWNQPSTGSTTRCDRETTRRHRFRPRWRSPSCSGPGCGEDRSDIEHGGGPDRAGEAGRCGAGHDRGRRRERGSALLDDLDHTLADLVAGDDISAARADDVRTAVAGVHAEIATWVAATTTTSTTTPPTTAAKRDQGEHPDRGKGRDKKDDD